MISFIDRQIIALMVQPIQRDLGIGDADVGWLYGGFAIFYAVAGLPIAYLADRKSRKWIIGIGIVAWSLMTMACGLAKNFWTLFAARIGVGVGEATLTPSTHSLLGDYFPPAKLPRAISVYQTGATIGSGLAFSIGGIVVELVKSSPPVTIEPLGTFHAWQMTFFYVGAPGILVASLMLAIREPVRRALSLGGGEPRSGPPKMSVSLRNLRVFYGRNWRTLLTHHLGFSSLAMVGYAFVFWTPTFYERVYGISAGTAGAWFGLYFISFATGGVLWAASKAERYAARGYKDANIRAGMVGGIFMVPLCLITPLMPSAFLAWILYAPLMFFVNSPFGLAGGSLPVIAPNEMRAQVAAVYSVVISIFGMAIGPPVAGAINDHVFTSPDGVRYSLMLMTAIFGPLGVGLLWIGRKYYAQSLLDAEKRPSGVQSA
jgi:MFS family permease